MPFSFAFAAMSRPSAKLRATFPLPSTCIPSEVPAVAAMGRGFDFSNGSHGLFRRLGSLARLAAHLLADIADAFALVGLGRPDVTQLRGHLAHQFLVDALDLQEDV